MTMPAWTTQGPLVGAEVWSAVMAAAGWRCECAGGCGRPHADRRRKDQRDPRCPRGDYPSAPLHAVPREDVTDVAAMRLAAPGLIALCDQCHAGVTRARKAAAARAADDRLRSAGSLF